MNYIKEMNAFKDWLLLHDVPTSAIVLWYTLMAINNATGWKETFNAPNLVVEQLTGLSKQGIADARKELVDHNLIRYEKGKKGKAPVYQIRSLVQSLDQSLDPSLDVSLDSSADQDLTIPKHKLKQKHKQSRGRGNGESPLTIYEQNFGILRPVVRESLLAWCNDLGDEIVIAGIKLAVKKGGRTFGYVEQILREWADKQLKTVDQVGTYEHEKQRANRKNIISFRGEQDRTNSSLFDELRREGGA